MAKGKDLEGKLQRLEETVKKLAVAEFALDIVDKIMREDNIESLVSTTLSYVEGYFKARGCVYLDYNPEENRFMTDKHGRSRIPEELAGYARDIAKLEFSRDSAFSMSTKDNQEMTYFLIALQKKNDGSKSKYGMLELIRETPFKDEEREAILKIARAFGTALGYFKSQSQADTDHLTKVRSRKRLDENLEQELRRAIRYDGPLAGLMIDIDNFKILNDSYGHQQGDRTLEEVADAIRNILRPTDVVGRYGGEEFVVVLPETTKDSAYRIAEQIRTAVESRNFENIREKDTPLKVTVSIGVASYTPGDAERPSNIKEFIDKADMQLYQAKRSGRNKVC